MDQKQSPDTASIGSTDPEPQASGSADPKPEQSSQDVYWLAQYFTSGKHNVGIAVMGVKYPQHWPKEKAEKAAKEVQAGDRYALRDLPITIKQESNVIKLLPCLFTLLVRLTCTYSNAFIPKSIFVILSYCKFEFFASILW